MRHLEQLLFFWFLIFIKSQEVSNQYIQLPQFLLSSMVNIDFMTFLQGVLKNWTFCRCLISQELGNRFSEN